MTAPIGPIDGDKLMDWLESNVWNCRDTQEKTGWNDAVYTLNGLVRESKFSLPSTPPKSESRYREALEKIAAHETQSTAEHACHFSKRIASEALSDRLQIVDGEPGMEGSLEEKCPHCGHGDDWTHWDGLGGRIPECIPNGLSKEPQ